MLVAQAKEENEEVDEISSRRNLQIDFEGDVADVKSEVNSSKEVTEPIVTSVAVTQVTTTTVSTPLKAEDKLSNTGSPTTSSGDKTASLGSIGRPVLGGLGVGGARPHHLPKANDALGAKMEEMRRKLLAQNSADEVST